LVQESVISACLKKDENAFRVFYESTINYSLSVIQRYIREDSMWKDIVQESYISVYKSLALYDPAKGDLKAWLRKIVVNHCLMHLRKSKHLSVLVPVQLADDFAEDQREFGSSYTKKDIELFLNQMPQGYRTVFLLVAIDEFTHDEVSKMLGISAETSRSQYSRARSWIRKNIFTKQKRSTYGIL
jgi:RNA polymerase sigma factor (sigma-70 family)